MPAFAAQPAKEYAHQHRGIEAVGLRSPMFARHCHAGRKTCASMQRTGQPACQPEAIPPGLVRHNFAISLLALAERFFAPTFE
ncbi:MAG TPA: hypothetical protein VEK34_06050 [Methylocella sp.]|nr:hypothetical protein [Methylocella sp.]